MYIVHQKNSTMGVPEPLHHDPFPEFRREDDAGAAFVLESKGLEEKSEKSLLF